MKKTDFTNYFLKRSNMLLATGFKYENKGTRKRAYLICMCDCGSQTDVAVEKFKLRVSCGCHKKNRIATLGKEQVKHCHVVGVSNGAKPSNTYINWAKVKSVCYHGLRSEFPIACHEYDKKWETFEGFLDDVGIIKDDEIMKRIDRKLTWCKENITLQKRNKYD